METPLLMETPQSFLQFSMYAFQEQNVLSYLSLCSLGKLGLASISAIFSIHLLFRNGRQLWFQNP